MASITKTFLITSESVKPQYMPLSPKRLVMVVNFTEIGNLKKMLTAAPHSGSQK